MYFFWYACPKLYEIIVKNVKELHFPKKVRNFFSQMKDLDPRRECLHKKKVYVALRPKKQLNTELVINQCVEETIEFQAYNTT